ncbi:hypothetical protein SUGI_1011380 [Cryptomeria japonica]|nr:hypothetical protein SUGI_1011380 [Cryptomeria japonica]
MIVASLDGASTSTRYLQQKQVDLFIRPLTQFHMDQNPNKDEEMVVAKLRLVAAAAADWAEMHGVLAQQRDGWNKLLLASLTNITKIVRPTVWWPQHEQYHQTQNRRPHTDKNTTINGWSAEVEEKLRGISETGSKQYSCNSRPVAHWDCRGTEFKWRNVIYVNGGGRVGCCGQHTATHSAMQVRSEWF